jgi:hypothetical protein
LSAHIDRKQCSTLLVTCSDFRIQSVERRFAEAAHIVDDYDLLARPGAARSLVQPATAAAGESMRDEIRLLWSIHRFERVLLVNHVRCGAYADLATAENELAVHADHLRRAVGVVEGMFNGVRADPYLVDFVGGDFVVVKVALNEV